MRVTLALLALVSVAACSDEGPTGENGGSTSRRLYGIVVPNGATETTVFLGYSKSPSHDLTQKLADVLAGVQLAEPWHMLVLPLSFLPAPDGMTAHDLSKHLGITITENTGWPGFSIQTGDLNWGSFSLESGAQGLQGRLTITGANIFTDVEPRAITPSGARYGVAFNIEYRGPLTVSNGLMLQNHGHHVDVGTYAAMTP